MTIATVDRTEPLSHGAPSTGIASIMVHVDFDPDPDSRIRIASNLADRFGATLIGVAVWVPGREFGPGAHVDPEWTQDRLEQVSVELSCLGERFRELACATVQPVEWRAACNFPSEIIAREARAADLIVIGARSAVDDPYHTFDPGAVIIAAGRPVLVVPDGVASLAPRRIAIAWKETREARHALQSAVAFLRVADHVMIIDVADEAMETAARASPRCRILSGPAPDPRGFGDRREVTSLRRLS